MMKLGRRQVIGGLGGLAVGGAVAGIMGNTLNAAEKKEVKAATPGEVQRYGQVGGEFGWKPHKLDPKESATVAYEGYWHKGYGCAYGTFYSMIGLMGEKHGAPYNQFPFTVLEAGKGGMDDWGVYCGALLGVQMAYALFFGRKERIPMMNELCRWYEITAFPIFNPGDKAQVKGDLPTSVANSVMCHVSLSRWCYKSKFEHSSKQRQERCGRLTADVAAKGIEIFNAKIDGTFKNQLKVADAVTTCGECHSPGKNVDIQKTKMDCTPCHSGNPHTANKFMNHP